MKRTTIFIATLIVSCFIFQYTGFAVNIDTGWVKREQPDGTMFIGKEWGDEFGMKYETYDGYRYVYNFKTKSYHYAKLNEKGGYTSSPWKVGIDDPVSKGIAKYLERSPERQAEIEAARKNDALQYQAKSISLNGNAVAKAATTITWHFKIILVDFDDWEGDSDYTIQEFEDMFDKSGYTSGHPDGEAVFGSIDDYYNNVSNGNFRVTCEVLNNDDGTGKPIWVPVGDDKEDVNALGDSAVFSLFASAASDSGYSTSTSSTTKVCYIYAGNLYDSSDTAGLHPRCNGDRYLMSEKIHSDHSYYTRNYENVGETFAHIGVHCHEIGHLIGLSHPHEVTKNWCVMRGGDKNGPRIGSCPAPPNPVYRGYKNWLSSYEEINSSVLNKQISNDIDKAYKIKTKSGDYEFVLEHWKAEDFRRYLDADSLSNSDLGLLIWQRYSNDHSNAILMQADGESTNNDLYGDPFPGNDSNTEISDYTNPTFEPYSLYNRPNPQIRIYDITRSDDYSTVDITIDYWQNDAAIWTRDVDIYNQNYSIPEDKTLTIDDNVTVKVRNEIGIEPKIDVYGTLVIDSGVLLTRHRPEGNYWGGIDVNSGGTLTINGAITIEDATIGINVNSDSLNFPTSKTTIQDCRDWGMLISSCSPTGIKNIDFQENGTTDSHGALCVQGSSSDPTITNVTIDDSVYGLYLSSYADATFQDSEITNGVQNHRIKMLTASDLDIDERENNIRDNDASYYAIYTGGNNIHAKDNYFDSSPQAQNIFSDSTKVLSWTPGRTTPYANAGAPAKMVANLLVRNPFIDAQETEMFGDMSSASKMYYDIIENREYMNYKRKAIKSLIRIADKNGSGYDGVRAVIHNELKTATSWYRESLDYLLCEILLREGKYQEAISAFSGKADTYKGSPMEVEMLSRIATIYGDVLMDKSMAKEYADKAAAINPGQAILLSAYASANIAYDPWKYKDKFDSETVTFELPQIPPEEPVSNITEEFVAVHPNPSNPVTTISYLINNSSHVKLDIYSISGQKIETLVDTYMSAGTHAVKFDGSGHGSGVYFFRLATDAFTKTGKMLIVK